jgi:hypothetical protein
MPDAALLLMPDSTVATPSSTSEKEIFAQGRPTADA